MQYTKVKDDSKRYFLNSLRRARGLTEERLATIVNNFTGQKWLTADIIAGIETGIGKPDQKLFESIIRTLNLEKQLGTDEKKRWAALKEANTAEKIIEAPALPQPTMLDSKTEKLDIEILVEKFRTLKDLIALLLPQATEMCKNTNFIIRKRSSVNFQYSLSHGIAKLCRQLHKGTTTELNTLINDASQAAQPYNSALKYSSPKVIEAACGVLDFVGREKDKENLAALLNELNDTKKQIVDAIYSGDYKQNLVLPILYRRKAPKQNGRTTKEADGSDVKPASL